MATLFCHVVRCTGEVWFHSYLHISPCSNPHSPPPPPAPRYVYACARVYLSLSCVTEHPGADKDNAQTACMHHDVRTPCVNKPSPSHVISSRKMYYKQYIIIKERINHVFVVPGPVRLCEVLIGFCKCLRIVYRCVHMQMRTQSAQQHVIAHQCAPKSKKLSSNQTDTEMGVATPRFVSILSDFLFARRVHGDKTGGLNAERAHFVCAACCAACEMRTETLEIPRHMQHPRIIRNIAFGKRGYAIDALDAMDALDALNERGHNFGARKDHTYINQICGPSPSRLMRKHDCSAAHS